MHIVPPIISGFCSVDANRTVSTPCMGLAINTSLKAGLPFSTFISLLTVKAFLNIAKV